MATFSNHNPSYFSRGNLCNFSKSQSLLQIHYRSDPDLKEKQKDSVRWFYGACMSVCMPLDFVQVSFFFCQPKLLLGLLCSEDDSFTILLRFNRGSAVSRQICQVEIQLKEIPVAHKGLACGLDAILLCIICMLSERVGEWGDQVTCKSHLITRPLRFSPLLLSSFESFERLPIVHFHFCEPYSLQHRVFFNVDVRCISCCSTDLLDRAASVSN